jgi:tRNA/rRNA methyltransferase
MGIEGELCIVSSPQIITEESYKLAKHAKDRLEKVLHFTSLEECLARQKELSELKPILSLAATARIGSAKRPHPTRVREALQRAIPKLALNQIERLVLVFGAESSGLTNEEIAICDWVVTVPSLQQYRSLNLAQSVLIFCYEANMAMLEDWEKLETPKPSSKEKLIQHMLQVAEDVGFILPGDPFKMRPRLEEIFLRLPSHIKEMKTLHGLLDQVRRSVTKGAADIKGRYRHVLLKDEDNGIRQ